MKVDGPSKTSGAKGVSKADSKKKTGDTSFSGMIDDTDEVSGPASVAPASSVMQIDALLSLQEAGDGTHGGAKKAKQRGEQLLNDLDKIRLGLLSGGVPISALNHLDHMVKQHREDFNDPQLSEILDEIELRVQVELAKHLQR